MKQTRLLAAMALLACLAPVAAAQDEWEYKDGQWVKAAAPAKGTPEGEIGIIRRMIRTGHDYLAVRQVKKFLKTHGDHPLREDAMMLAGQAEINRGRYYQAYDWYRKQWEEFPSGQYAERAIQREYDIADAFLKGKKRIVLKIFRLPARAEGMEILNRIAEQAPGSALAEISLIRIADEHFSRREYLEAAIAYDRHVELFSKSGKVRESMLQAARATHLGWRGIEFDVTPLIEAQQRYKTFNEQYPQTAAKSAVPATIRQIETQRAAEEFNTARFYDRTGKRHAAAYYYRRVEDLYGGTDYAARAKIGIASLGPLASPKPPPPRLDGPKLPLPPPPRPTTIIVATAPMPPATTRITATTATAPPVPPRRGPDAEPMDIEKLLPPEED